MDISLIISAVVVAVLMLLVFALICSVTKFSRGYSPVLFAFVVFLVVGFSWGLIYEGRMAWVKELGVTWTIVWLVLIFAALQVACSFFVLTRWSGASDIDPVWVLVFALVGGILDVFYLYLNDFLFVMYMVFDAGSGQALMADMDSDEALSVFNQVNAFGLSSSVYLLLVSFAVVVLKVFSTLFLYRGVSERAWLWVPLSLVTCSAAVVPAVFLDLSISDHFGLSMVLAAILFGLAALVWYVLRLDKAD